MPLVLVVGATGVLRPAVLALAARGDDVVAVARDPGRLADLARAAGTRVRTVAGDAADPGALAAALPRDLDAALLYRPAASTATAQMIAARTRRPVVELLTSGAADPALVGPDADPAALPAVGGVRVLLGWTDGPRWHTPDEISRAALAALDDGADRVLGRVRPWHERPGP